MSCSSTCTRLPLAERLDVIRRWRADLHVLDREAAEQHYRQLAVQAWETALTDPFGARGDR